LIKTILLNFHIIISLIQVVNINEKDMITVLIAAEKDVKFK
jgi:hypothetical protein